jgi:zinc and cadmium transporter
MALLVWIIIFSAVGGVLSVLVASVFLLLPAGFRARLLPAMVSFAIGALLGAAFLALLPHALEAPGVDGAHRIMAAVLLGVLLFFILEKLVLWRHCHTHECDVHGSTSIAGGAAPGATERHASGHGHGNASAAGHLILLGDGIHNFVDGVLIAAAFLTDIHLGIITAIAVAAHEIPQELGDFAILLDSGFTRRKALLYNVLAGLTTVVGAVLAYYSLAVAQAAVPYVLAIAASSFIYIAVADLIPGLHKRVEGAATLQQGVLIAFGVATIYTAHSLLH